MIENIFIDGIQINNSNVFLADIGNIGSSSVEFNNYVKGGVSGQVLSVPLKRGMNINLTFRVFANNYTSFYEQRDRLIRLLQNKNTTTDYLKTLSVELGDGTKKEVDVLFSQVVTGITPTDKLSQSITVTAVSEKEYFNSVTDYTQYLYLQDLGGMAVPMDVPMDLSNNPINTTVTINNAGNARGYPRIKIYDDFASGFSLLNNTTGEELGYSEATSTSDILTIDMYNRTIIDQTNTSKLANVNGDWLSLASGDNEIQLIGSSGDGGYGIIYYNNYYLNI